MNSKLIDRLYDEMPALYQERTDQAVTKIVHAKQEGQKVGVVTGSGPNIHEGVTTLIAELIRVGIVDGGVLTSSAVIAHEMAGALDRVKRVDGTQLDFGDHAPVWLPRGDKFELTVLPEAACKALEAEMPLDWELIDQLQAAEGDTIIKAAGNMAYPMGLRTERLARWILQGYCGKARGTPAEHDAPSLEYGAGMGADPRTMIGAGARAGVPVLVSIPQLVGGGAVGVSVGDSISIHERCRRNAAVLGDSQVIIESGLALAQEIHDGPFETFTGHGVWAQWTGEPVYSLQGKDLVRFDLDPNLEHAWEQERDSGLVQRAIAEGKPKTKLTGVPFRMEMSGFARLETSIPVIGDLGAIWPVVASRVATDLGVHLEFMSYPQETPAGQEMREYIVEEVRPVDRNAVKAAFDAKA